MQTLDCPAPYGVRKIDDVLAGYRASGEFCAARWLIFGDGPLDVGCLIVTAFPEHGTCELTYMGAAPASRARLGDRHRPARPMADPPGRSTEAGIGGGRGQRPGPYRLRRRRL